ncbi:unnamed protein product [Trichogramma brassicae]|uniref:Uncharacterized protein n=1 Tax=Trichogramma brassicae TaxID=86971 RepID=A0A6H5IP15_9HYME|nr:unnamed protein product [Trichogramma brassicae]
MRISKHSRLVDICQLCYRSIEKLVESTWNVRRFCQSRWSWAWISVDDGESIYPWAEISGVQGTGHGTISPKLNEARSMRCDIVAECAGITVCGGEREIIESKIKRLIPDVPPKLGHTDKIVHRIELVEGAKPVCHRTRRMTPKMEKIAHECLQKMKEEGIIEPAKSEWNSAPVLRSYNALLDPVSNAENSWRLVVPAEQRERVLTESHCLTSSGHLEPRKRTIDWRASIGGRVCGMQWRSIATRATYVSDIKYHRPTERPYDEEGCRSTLGSRGSGYDGVPSEWSATPTRSNGVRLPPLSGEQPEGLHRQSGRRWTSERGRRAPRETPARRQEPAKRRWLS